MNFNKHSHLEGRHALLSASQYSWINYDDQKMYARYLAAAQAARGTALHALAHNAIKLGVKLAKSDPALSMYVTDGIGYKMETEQTLFYSSNCFGTADTISFRRNKLRIHDLKSGLGLTSPTQLFVYAALFCLEYSFSPWEIDIECRIYQNMQNGDPPVRVYIPTADEILHIMDRIIYLDKLIETIKEQEG